MSKQESKLRWRDFKVLRKAKGYTQKELAPRLGMSQAALSIHETRHADELVEPETAQKLLEAPVNPEPKLKVKWGLLVEGAVQWVTAPIRLPAGTWRAIELRPRETLPADVKLPLTFILVRSEPSRPGDEPSGSEPGTPSVEIPPGVTSSALVGSLGRSIRSLAMMTAVAVSVSCLTRTTSGHGEMTAVAREARTDGARKAEEIQPRPVPSQIYTDNATQAPAAGKSEPRRSIVMPKKSYSWQKTAPCDPQNGETEKVGGCWTIIKKAPPCPDFAVEDTDTSECVIPVPAKPSEPKRPLSSNP